MNKINFLKSFSMKWTAVIGLFLVSAFSYGQQTFNPVIRGVADAGCMKYAGKYYLGGVATYGDFFVSDDLIHWNKRVHVFDLDNEWTHGTGAKNNQVHADDISYSGGLFHLLFSVNYWGADRHIVHITHATSPVVTGPYREVRNDQWFENRIDPMVFRDDDGKLYLYMVKFTDGNAIWGRPMHGDFTFAGDAVMQFSSQPGTWETMDNRVAEGPFVIKYRDCYYMMYNTNHTATEYGNYRLGVCEASAPLAFNAGGKYSYPVMAPNTAALDDRHADLLRYGSGTYRPFSLGGLDSGGAHFQLASLPAGKVFMKVAQRGGCKVFLNGSSINEGASREYKFFPVDKSLLRRGDNVITVSTPQHGGRSGIKELSLYDFGSATPDDILLTPGQPNIVRGPNGWEWWLSYMANVGWERSQFVDRIHFVNGRLSVDGITGPHTTGFHPAPALPQYRGQSIDSLRPSDSYLLELTFSSPLPSQGIRVAGVNLMLPDSLRHGVAHEWRIEKNHGLLSAWVDRIRIANHVPALTTDSSVCWAGSATDYKIDYVAYNDGYDEFGSHFSGWNPLKVTSEGLALTAGTFLKGQPAANYELSVQLDDKAASAAPYGVMAAWWNPRNYVRVGIQSAASSLLVDECVKGRHRLRQLPLDTCMALYPDVKYSDTYEKQYRFDHDVFIDSVFLPRYDLGSDTYADNLSLPAGVDGSSKGDVASRLVPYWLDGDTWRQIDYTVADDHNPAWQTLRFPKVRTCALRFLNKDAKDNRRNIYRIRARVSRQTVNQLRVDRRGRQLYVYLNNRLCQVLTLSSAAPARCGLFAEGDGATVNNTLYYVVSER